MSSGLLGSAVLEIAIGLSFVYLLLALLCTTFNEWIAGLFKTRATLLAEGIRQLLDNQPHGNNTFLTSFYAHPLIRGLMRGDAKPSYLPARQFAAVILDYLAQGNAGPAPAGVAAPPAVAAPVAPPVGAAPAPAVANAVDIVKWIETGIPNGDVKDALRALTPPGGGDFATLQKNIEGWFDDAMDRVSGWHKRRTQVWTLIVASIFTVAVNADTFKIVRHLASDPVLRQAVVESAKSRAAEPRPSVAVEYKDPNDPLKPSVSRLNDDPLHKGEQDLLSRLIGWGPEESDKQNPIDWLLRVLGWLISVAAISLGAPFWFDTLNKFINIRSAGKSPDEASKTPSKAKLSPANKAP